MSSSYFLLQEGARVPACVYFAALPGNFTGIFLSHLFYYSVLSSYNDFLLAFFPFTEAQS